jgi:hypothetical protein
MRTIELLEPRRFLAADFAWESYEFRSLDGYGTNEAHPQWGAAGSPLIRVAAADYRDGSGQMIRDAGDRENPRVISNRVAAQGEALIPNDRALSDFVWQWGQFLDHDTDLVPADSSYGTANIPMPAGGDPVFGDFELDFSRSMYEASEASVRQQVNTITAFIDASNVYGSDPVRAAALRTFSRGQLKTSAGRLLPLNDTEPPLPNAGDDMPGAPLFLAGDERANEQVGLTALHTVFLREHNRLAERIARRDPSASDEQVYQLARKIVGAEMQIITYEEFLPALLGRAPLPPYRGYDATVNPSIANEFAGALFRLGHSLLSPRLLLLEPEANPDVLPLRDAFFNPDFLRHDPGNVERLLRGLAAQPAQEIDNKIVDDVRNFLFGRPGLGGLDLASLNIQRGRDHGLPDYNSLRAAYGLERITGFHQITTDRSVRIALRELYGSVDNIDPWVGALAEDHVRGTSVGPLIQRALVDQFTRLRDGDRYFYRFDRDLRRPEIRQVIRLSRISLAQVLEWNTDMDDSRRDVFHVPKVKCRGRGCQLVNPVTFLPQSPASDGATFPPSAPDGGDARDASKASPEPIRQPGQRVEAGAVPFNTADVARPSPPVGLAEAASRVAFHRTADSSPDSEPEPMEPGVDLGSDEEYADVIWRATQSAFSDPWEW